MTCPWPCATCARLACNSATSRARPTKRLTHPGPVPRHARPALAQPLHGVDRHGRRQPGHGEGVRGGTLDLLLHQGVGGRADAHRPGRRVLLEAQGHLRRLAHGRIGPLGEPPEGPRHHQPRVHPQLHGHRALVSGGVLGQGGLAALPEVARRQHGPPRVVLLRRWGAKQGRKPSPALSVRVPS